MDKNMQKKFRKKKIESSMKQLVVKRLNWKSLIIVRVTFLVIGFNITYVCTCAHVKCSKNPQVDFFV